MDSNVLIDYAGKKFKGKAEQRLDEAFDDMFYYSIISRLEVLGYNAPAEILDNIEEFLSTGTMYNITDKVGEESILIRRSVPKLKLPDAIIAATALSYNHTLLTRNIDDFKNIPRLRLTTRGAGENCLCA